ncbi:MAG TPA: hypothetical protein ENK57_05895 [Polyangiaceae bacterium]|nr:hypothetical protein [Polyangiaceae bacterium]
MTEPALAMSTGDEQPVQIHDALANVDLSGLPSAPWEAEPVQTDEVPGALLRAWSIADNRGECAPIVPAAMGAAEGAHARVSEMVEGGWAVEYDHRGLPGLAANGNACANCGRGVFGIAGTAMSPDTLAGESTLDVPEPSFADGSHLEVEAPADGETVAAAMITLRGQGCVYQVWSFLGEDHVRELVDGLRRVEMREDTSVAVR